MVVMFFISASLFSEGFYGAGSFSYEPVKVADDIPEGDYFRTSLIAGYEWNGLYAETEQNTDMVKGALHMFSPYNTEYYMRAGYRYKQVYVQYEHLCVHGVDRYNPDGGHDRVTVGFDTRFEKD